MLFGSNRDFNLLVGINKELLSDIIEQEIRYYKFSVSDMESNIYGESTNKIFLDPVYVNCLITRGDQIISVDEFGPDLNREASFAFLRRDLEDKVLVPEVGDIVEWQRDYYEVDTVRENQLFIGRDKSYNLTDYGQKFGTSVSIIVDCHLTRGDKVGLMQIR